MHRKRFMTGQYYLLCIWMLLSYIYIQRKCFIPGQCCLLCTWMWLSYIYTHWKRFIPGRYCLLCTWMWLVYIHTHKKVSFLVDTACYVLGSDLYKFIHKKNVLYRVNTACYILRGDLHASLYIENFYTGWMLPTVYLGVTFIHSYTKKSFIPGRYCLLCTWMWFTCI